jgi:hypothetical protein
MSDPTHYPGAPIPIPAIPPEIHGVLCDVCGQEIAGTQKLVTIPGIGYMHDGTEVPNCVFTGRAEFTKGLREMAKRAKQVHVCVNIEGTTLLVTQNEDKARAFCDQLNAQHGVGWCWYDDFTLDVPTGLPQ